MGTRIGSQQIGDDSVSRADLNVDGILNGAAAATGISVIRKVIQGVGISLTSTGFDAGTGDVTINVAGTVPTSLTTVGTTGVATLSGNVLNIPNYSSGGSSPTAYAETPTGTVNGSNTAFTLANTPSSTLGVIVLLDGVTQYNGIDYTVSGSTITFTTAPVTGSSIFAYYNTLTGAGSGISRSIISISSTTTASASTNTDYVYIATGTFTFTLPTAVSNTNRYTVKNAGSGTITITTTSSQTMDGSTSLTLPVQYSSLDFISDGTNWQII